jgi:chaperone BCS1
MFDEIYNFVAHQLATNQFFSAAALSGGLMSILYQLKSIPNLIMSRLYRLLYYSITIEQQDPLFKYLDLWTAKYHSSKFRRIELKSTSNSEGNINPPQSSNENDYIFIWYKFRRIKILKTKEKIEGARDSWDLFNRTYKFSGFFARKAINNLMKELLLFAQTTIKEEELKRAKPKLYLPDGFGWSETKELEGKSFDNLFLVNKEELIEDLDKFKASKELYNRLYVPYKRGYLFYGAPGNGKSSVAFAMADYLRTSVYVLDIASMSTEKFVNILGNIRPNSILVIEDIDTFYDGRKALGEVKINFSSFLNALNGINQKNNIITVFTTNHIESLDPALLREGRCDFKLELFNPSNVEANAFLSKVFERPITLPRPIKKMSFASLQFTILKNIDNLPNCIDLLCEPA